MFNSILTPTQVHELVASIEPVYISIFERYESVGLTIPNNLENTKLTKYETHLLFETFPVHIDFFGSVVSFHSTCILLHTFLKTWQSIKDSGSVTSINLPAYDLIILRSLTQLSGV